MGDVTKIEWADTTLNYWVGCTQLKRRGGSACDDCYAMRMAPRLRMGVVWNGPPVRGRPAWWQKLPAYQRSARRFRARHGRRRRVFINSMSDFFDNQAQRAWRDEACAQMEAAPDVICMLLTKRPENVVKMVPKRWLEPGGWPENVWLGVTAEAQDVGDHRVMILRRIHGPRVRFVSIEPLLEDLDVETWLRPLTLPNKDGYGGDHGPGWSTAAPINWVILGGESGRKARPMSIKWVRRIIAACQLYAVPVLFKQWGEWCPAGQATSSARSDGNYPVTHLSGDVTIFRVGKKVAGRAVDGTLYTEFPEEQRLAA